MNLLFLDEGRIFVMGNHLSLGLQAGRASAGRGAAPKSNWPSLCGSEQGISHEMSPVPVPCVISGICSGMCLLGGFVGVHADTSGWSLALTLLWSKQVPHTFWGSPEHSSALVGLGALNAALLPPGIQPG